jgi:hypothetical protein
VSPKPWRRARSGISGCVEREEDPHTAAYIVEAGDTRCLVRQSQEHSGPLGERHFAKKEEGSACRGARLPVWAGRVPLCESRSDWYQAARGGPLLVLREDFCGGCVRWLRQTSPIRPREPISRMRRSS